MIVTDRTRMFQAHFVAASSRNKEWPGKQHSKLISECGAEGTRTRRSEGMGASGHSDARRLLGGRGGFTTKHVRHPLLRAALSPLHGRAGQDRCLQWNDRACAART